MENNEYLSTPSVPHKRSEAFDFKKLSLSWGQVANEATEAKINKQEKYRHKISKMRYISRDLQLRMVRLYSTNVACTLVRYVGDNADINVHTLDGNNTLHVMGMIKIFTPKDIY
ncbi:hypothetical protein TNIN_110371 [Trichonephila inaurata madagascariensis]|uniref:Uncharacterized protein n=1 Tax=Trichonephila inaurata madagascariensis TaxID=2747483 RepID=A0A8X7BZY8_9ARAC|nr:hypothetical protein TNIN_110371 [Trichonephila inaurata madagascariensis]